MFVREVIAMNKLKQASSLPYLLYLQGTAYLNVNPAKSKPIICSWTCLPGCIFLPRLTARWHTLPDLSKRPCQLPIH